MSLHKSYRILFAVVIVFEWATIASAVSNSKLMESVQIDWNTRIGQKLSIHEPEEYMRTNELIERFGYPSEVHNVTTDDGYILEIFRIPPSNHSGLQDVAGLQRTPVLLQHGLLSSSDSWVINFENESLGFMLAAAGFDVWVSNVRGNRYGQDHVPPKPCKHDFYQFSWDEMAKYDLPAVIDYVLNVTGSKDLQYVGFSMGTTIGFAMLSSEIEYNSKIRHFHALAPVALMNSVQSKIKYLAPFIDEIEVIVELIGADDFLPNSALIKALAKDCNSTWREACANIVFLLCGYDPKELNRTRLPVYFSHTPAGTSAKTVIHYVQEINSGYFRRYDYGFFENWWRYGQFTPPQYDVTKITTPMTLHWSANDLLADPADVDRLYQRLTNSVEKHQVGDDQFSHFDFVWGVKLAPQFNDYLIQKLQTLDIDSNEHF